MTEDPVNKNVNVWTKYGEHVVWL